MILLINVAFFIFSRSYRYTMLMESILFTIQALMLFGINYQLNKVVSGLFNSE